MGKFTKDKRVLKRFLYSKTVGLEKFNLYYNRTFTIEKQRKMDLELDQPISYCKLTRSTMCYKMWKELSTYVLHQVLGHSS